MKSLAGTFDFILDTVIADHDLNAYLNLLSLNGAMVTVGMPITPAAVSAFSLVVNNRTLAGSGIGGIEETNDSDSENRRSVRAHAQSRRAIPVRL